MNAMGQLWRRWRKSEGGDAALQRVIAVGKRHPFEDKGRPGTVSAMLFPNMVVATFWFEGSDYDSLDILKRRIDGVAVCGEAGRQGVAIVIAFAAEDDLGKVIPFAIWMGGKPGSDSLFSSQVPAELVLVGADTTDGRVLHVESIKLEAEIAGVLSEALRVAAEGLEATGFVDAAAAWQEGRRWLFVPDSQRGNAYARTGGHFREHQNRTAVNDMS